MPIKIILSKCTGCRKCIPVCPFSAIEVVDKKAKILDNCTLCGACVDECRFDAIVLEKEEKKISTDEYKGVWIFAEQRHNELQTVTLELLNEARKLADILKEELSVVLLGNKVDKIAQGLIFFGADKVYLVSDSNLESYKNSVYTDVLVHVVNKYKPEIFLIGATTIGRSLAPRVATRLQTGLTADCTGLSIDLDKRLLLQTRPAFGGNIMATIICPQHRPQMATVRPKVFKKPEKNPGRKGEIVKVAFELKIDDLVAKIVDTIVVESQVVDLQEAEIIVSGGRGLGKAENFSLIRELAISIGGAVGASRATVGAGWIPSYHQVGQTGKTVQPRLYIACGISGAVQHLVGMRSSDVIVAINKDPDAPIFQVATYGIVANLFDIVPALTKKLKQVLS